MRFLIYARASEPDNSDINQQIEMCSEFANKLGAVEIKIFKDTHGEVERTGRGEMFSEYRSGDMIVAMSLDRITRSLPEYQEFSEGREIKFVR